MDKPKVLVLGGTGFIGRNLVKMLVDKDFASYIRVVDKVFPQTAFLSQEHNAVYNTGNCEFMQGNLINTASIEKCFTVEGGKFDFVFNCAAETKLGQELAIYKEKTLELIKKCSAEAVKQKVSRFIHLSNAQVYKPSKKPQNESGKTDPWTNLATVQLEGDKYLVEQSTKGLDVVILRPSIVYGPGDTTGLAPRIICAAVYKHLKKTMKFLWSGDLRLNTVHVHDVCKAMIHLAEPGKCASGTVYNMCDKNDTDQEKINKILEAIFGIKTGYQGTITSNLAKTFGMKGVTEEVNNEHLKPWSDLCKEHNVANTPLSPYLDPELLYDNNFCIDGSAIEKTGFSYDYPKLTEQSFREMIEYYSKQSLFPGF